MALVLGAILSLGSVRSTSASGPSAAGLQDGWAVSDQGQTRGAQLLLDQLGTLDQSHAGWVRINFRLGPCFQDWTTPGCNGRSALQVYDNVVSAVQGHGFRVLGLIGAESWRGGQSDWTAGNAEFAAGTGSNAYIMAFAQGAAGTLAASFAGRVSAWEVWNEPNAWSSNSGPGVYAGASFIYPSNFAQVLSQSARAIRAKAPTATVISGGLLGMDVDGMAKGARGGYQPRLPNPACPSLVPSGGDYLCSTYDSGRQYAGWTGGSPFDRVGQHLYVDQTSITTSTKLSAYLADLRAVYMEYGAEPPSTKTVVTEFGWSTPNVSPNVQAYNLTLAYRTFQPEWTPYVDGAYWFRVQDMVSRGDGYGLLDGIGAPKPALRAYQSVAEEAVR